MSSDLLVSETQSNFMALKFQYVYVHYYIILCTCMSCCTVMTLYVLYVLHVVVLCVENVLFYAALFHHNGLPRVQVVHID